MKYSISSPNQFLFVYDFLGQHVPGVIEYDDETKETKMLILSSSNTPIRIINDNKNYEPVVVTVLLPGSTIDI